MQTQNKSKTSTVPAQTLIANAGPQTGAKAPSSPTVPMTIQSQISAQHALFTLTASSDRIKAFADQLHSFLVRASKAFQNLSDESAKDLNDAYAEILDLNESIPEWVDSFTKENARKLEQMSSPGEVARWTKLLSQVARDASKLPAKMSTNRAGAIDWLGTISKPLRALMREFNTIADKARRAELSAPKTPSTTLTPAAPSLKNSSMKDQINRVVLKDFPELAKHYGLDDKAGESGANGDERTRKWVDDQVSQIKRANPKKILVPEPGTAVLFRAPVLADIYSSNSTRMEAAFTRAGLKFARTMGFTHVKNAMVMGVDGVNAQIILRDLKRLKPGSEINKYAYGIAGHVFKHKGTQYFLLLPAVMNDDVDGMTVKDWRFAS